MQKNKLFYIYKKKTEKQGVVFGIPLLDSLKYAHSRISYLDERTNNQCNAIIPTIIAKCGAFLKEKGDQSKNKLV